MDKDLNLVLKESLRTRTNITDSSVRTEHLKWLSVTFQDLLWHVFHDFPAPCTACRSTSFYRATLCISAVFAVTRCQSVCLSVTLVYCIQTAEDIVKLLSRPGSPIILVFCPPAPVPNSKGKPLQRVCKIQGGGKIL